VAVGRQGGTSSYGVLNVSGTGNIRMTAGDTRWFQVGALGGQGFLNMTGGTVEATNGGDLRLSEGATGYGQANLSGGLLKVDRIVDNGATSYLYLNGTNMQARISTTSYLQDLDTAIVGQGGAIFDTNGQNITVAQTLVGSSGDGVLTIPVTDGGSGYPAQPIVKISGDGTGASAVANVVGGVLQSITITNPGTGYVQGNTFVTLIDGGATVAATLGDPTVGANVVDGGLTKNGDGTLTITASNNYAGTTTVNDGTLEFTASQTLSSLVIADGATVVLAAAGPAPGFSGAPGLEAEASSFGPESQIAAVPEPGALGLLAAGIFGVLGRRRRVQGKG
jgi:autotransporter-associated beta strand protein